MSHRRRFLLKSLALLLAALPGAGCTRKFFRQRADRDVEQVLTEKNVFEPWRIENWHVYPDPRARFADPSNPDRPPMPPDDPASQYLAPNPQKPGKAGVGAFEGTGYLELLAAWDAMNRANQPPQLPAVEAGRAPPAAPAPPVDCAPGTVERPFLINLEQCCELGLINSRDYQAQRENLYLTALPVTLQRFSFAAQLFARGNAAFQTAGEETAAPGQRWLVNTNAGFSKLFPTGATLLAQVASRFVVDLTNGTPSVGISNLTLDLTQPLLRDGGKAVTLEPLTQSERDLLYQIRNYARFRKQFFVQLAAGRGQAGGGGAAAALVDPSLGALAAAIGGPTTGYLPAVRQYAILEADRDNVRQFERFLRRFIALAEGGEVSQLQVDQLRQSVLSGQQQVLNDELQLRNALDNFKVQLGLPPTLHLELDDAPIRPIREQLNRFQEPISQFQGNTELIEAYFGAAEDAGKLRTRLKAVATGDLDGVIRELLAQEKDVQRRQRLEEIARTGPLTAGTQFRERIVTAWGSWERLTDARLTARLAALREERRNLLAERSRLEGMNEAVPEALLARLATAESDLRLGTFEQDLREYEKQPWKQLANAEVGRRRQQSAFSLAADSFELLLIEARNERFDQVRRRWPELPRACVDGVDLIAAPLETAYARAAQTALTNRLDLMNARGDVMDRWRQIAVRANSLLGVFDVGYSLNSATPAALAQPLNFSSARTTQQLRFNGELPLVRRVERNNYRAALINYQRGRRQLQLTEDNILNDVRAELRQLRVLAQNYKIQQELVVLAYNTVENALETFAAPALPTGAVGPPQGGAGAGSAAALTQQLQTAQRTLNQAQTQLYRTWIDYHTLRMELFFDLELLPLDARGVWIDDHATRDCDPSCLPVGGPGIEPAPAGQPLPAPQPAEPGDVQWRARTSAPPWAAKR